MRRGVTSWLGAGLLTVASCGRPAPAPEAIGDPAEAQLVQRPAADAPVTESTLAALYERLPPFRVIGGDGHAAARAFLLEELRASGWSPEVLPFSWAGAAGADLANVSATRAAVEPGAPLLIVCAHYDSVAGAPGADDNGSGTVALLELARRLAGPPGPVELRLVFFDAEEPGLIGSGEYVRGLSVQELRRMIGAINLETMAYTDRRDGSQHLPPGAELLLDTGDRGDFLLVVGTLASQDLARAVGAGLEAEQGPGFRAVVFSKLAMKGWPFPDTRRSDHAHFWDAGVPALMLTDTANLRSPHYHRASDRVETLDLPFLAAAVRGVERAVRSLTEDAR